MTARGGEAVEKVGTYIIIQESTLGCLEIEVSRACEAGWIPVGAPVIVRDSGEKFGFFYGQALVHPETSKRRPKPLG